MNKQDIFRRESDGVQENSEDINKWELEVEPLLDKIFNKLVGKKEDEEGKWVDDPHVTRSMNELGASEFVQEIRMRFNINMQNGELSSDDIRDMITQAGDNFADKLADKYEEWEVDPSESNLRSICYWLVHGLKEWLSIAKNGGMKLHRERRNGYTPAPSLNEGGVV